MYLMPRKTQTALYDKIDGVSYVVYERNAGTDMCTGCIIFSHGMSGTIDGLQYYNKVIGRLAPEHDLIMYDYYGYGESNGNSSIKGCVDSLMVIYRMASRLYKQIILWGESLGGGINAEFVKINATGTKDAAGKDIARKNMIDAIDLIVQQESFPSISEPLSHVFPLLGLLSYFHNDLNATDVYKKYDKNLNLLILHSIDDDIIPFDGVQKMYHELRKNDKLSVSFIPLRGRHCQFDVDGTAAEDIQMIFTYMANKQ